MFPIWRCARDMLAAKNIRPAFASHNALTVATILEWAGDARDFEFQRLHGMGDGLYERLVRDEGYRCRIYAPVGGHRDLLAYLVRRLLENGANSSFVHQLADEHLSEEEILADPVAKVTAVGGTRHPSSIPLPKDLFVPERKNSAGLDLNDRAVLEAAAEAVNKPFPGEGRGLVSARSAERATARDGDGLDRGLRRGTGFDAITRAQAAFATWTARPVDERATILERLADLLEENRDELMAICVQEAFKTIPDALGEVREAVDFCRYYAARARRRSAIGRTAGADRRAQHDASGWARRVGDDRAVEFSAGDFPGADGGRARHRQHRDRQARAADAAHRRARGCARASRRACPRMC